MLVWTGIVLLSFRYYEVPNLVEKMSFALTLSSLVLAVLAIFYTVVAAQKQDLQLAKLIETNASLGGAATQIRDAAEDVRLFARDAPTHFQSLGQKLDQLSSSYRTLRSIDSPSAAQQGKDPSLKLAETPPTVTAANATQSTIAPPTIDLGHFRWMFIQMQFGAMAALYLFTKSHGRDRCITAQIVEKVGIGTLPYVVGFLNGMEAAGLLEFKIHNDEIIPVMCKDLVKENIRSQIDDLVNIMKKKPPRGTKLEAMVSAIDELFAS